MDDHTNNWDTTGSNWDTTGNNWNFTWTNGTATTNTDNFIFSTNTTSTTLYHIRDDKDWMPYFNAEYEPKWHKKYARYKIQMEKMWD